MKSRVLGCLGISAVALLLLSVALNVFFLLFAFRGEKDRRRPELKEEIIQSAAAERPSAKIAHIDIAGLISNMEIFPGMGGADLVDGTKRALEQALGDDAVKAIVLRIDSPGGEVTASDTIYHAVKKAREKKPVIIYMDTMAASGGYYISCAGTKIVANQNTWTGSIGVVVQSLGYGEAFNKLGLEMRVFRSGNFKDTFYGQRKLTPEEEEYIQKLIMETYERFVKIVSDARRIPVETLKTQIADGRVFSGAEALKNGLVDQNGYIEDAYDLARKEAGVKDAEVIRYNRHFSLFDILSIQAQNGTAPRKIEIDLMNAIAPKIQPGRCYLLPAHLVQ